MSHSTKSTPGKTKPSLFTQIGGEKTINDASRTFVARLRKDPRTAKAFEGVQEQAQVKMLSGFIGHVTGGPAHTGPSMYEFHRDLRLNEAHFDAYLAILEESLMDCDLEKAAVEKIMREVREQRNEVLGKDKKNGGCCLGAWWSGTCQHFNDPSKSVYVHAAGATLATAAVLAVGFFAYKHLRKAD